jgi:hypothetical protein
MENENKPVVYDDPTEVIAQIGVMGRLLGQSHVFGTISEQDAHGLLCIFAMIEQNAESMIGKLTAKQSGHIPGPHGPGSMNHTEGENET